MNARRAASTSVDAPLFFEEEVTCVLPSRHRLAARRLADDATREISIIELSAIVGDSVVAADDDTEGDDEPTTMRRLASSHPEVITFEKRACTLEGAPPAPPSNPELSEASLMLRFTAHELPSTPPPHASRALRVLALVVWTSIVAVATAVAYLAAAHAAGIVQ
jgi:hypothetical protein